MVKILRCGKLPNLKSYSGLLPGEKEDLDGTSSAPRYQGQISGILNPSLVFVISHTTVVEAVLLFFFFFMISGKHQF